MVEYTNIEYTDMMLVYDKAEGNGRAAHRSYQDHYQHRVTTLHSLFAKVIQRLREEGTFTVNRADCSAPRRHLSPNFEEDVTHHVEETP